MEALIIQQPLVSVDWLYSHLNASNLIVLDASMNKVTDLQSDSSDIQIPKARFFDIKNDFSNTDDPFPNAVPSQNQFNRAAQKLGINSDSAIVVYDDKGIYSSARVWWLFKAFGHQNIAVLNGGLPAWVSNGYPTEAKVDYKGANGTFKGTYHADYFKDFKAVQNSISNSNHLIIDARAENRFNGLVEEPRQGLRSGHIPNSVNLPYSRLLNHKSMKKTAEIKAIFSTFNITGKHLVFSCGSGITACILALGADLAGIKNTAVYDGSWTEYGILTSE